MESLVAVACISYYIRYQDGISLLVVISIVALYRFDSKQKSQ